MRVLCVALLSKGTQNEQTLELGRKFLSDNRLLILAVLKKSAGIATAVEGSAQSVDDLAESFMLLISITDFMDVSDTGSK